MPWPQIVAESLLGLAQPAQVAAGRPILVPVEKALEAVRTAAAPSRSSLAPPQFLRADQHDPWRRVMAALDGFGGALLVEPVGSGKTWIALAVAACEERPAVVIVPAILQGQWRDAAARAAVPVHLWTHERASRSRVPDNAPALVIIDEAHRFRDPGTRRVHAIAPWLIGRRTLLLTATPIVNRSADLVTLLRLALPDDALALDGIARLGDLEMVDGPPIALRRVAVRTSGEYAGPARRRVVTLAPDAAEDRRGADAVMAIRQLELSTCPAIRRLLESVLLDAAASSDAAFRTALRRYRGLLLQARDAGGASRAMLRQFAGDSLDQLVLWPLLITETRTGELPLADIARVEAILAAGSAHDEWIGVLTARCDDARPTVCFTRHRATARQLREAWGETAAWVTGSDAGIGPHRVARAAILNAFGPHRGEWHVRRALPRALVATDVAAEGLDLHAAGRIVHVDLPWTAMRIEQREGRLLRIGQQHEDVEVIVRLPAVAIENALAPHARVRRKRHLADEWLRSLEAYDADRASVASAPVVSCVVDDEGPAGVIAVRLQRERRTGVVVLARRTGDSWRVDAALTGALLERARIATSSAIDAETISAELAGAMRAALLTTAAGEFVPPTGLVARIHRLARSAATHRDGLTLRRLDRLLQFVAKPPTLGARLVMARLADVGDDEFLSVAVPDAVAPESPRATVIAAVLFRSTAPLLR